MSSARYHQSNGRAELAVKTTKRTLIDYTDEYGRLRHDLAARAMMTHRNTPHQDLGLSPAEMLYGRVIRDHLPILREKYQIHKRWREIRELRERAMAKRHLLNQKHYNIHSHPFRELQVGESVQVLNQEGPLPRRWMKTGRVVEKMINKQYRVRQDGSNRVTLRNRRFLRKILPVVDTPNYTPHKSQPLIQRQMPVDSETPCIEPEMMEVVYTDVDRGMADHTGMEVEENQHPIVQPPPSLVLRHTTRVIRPPRSLSPQMR